MEIPSEYVLLGVIVLRLIEWIGSKASHQAKIFENISVISDNLRKTAEHQRKTAILLARYIKENDGFENERISKANGGKTPRA
jgi:hypothetical protein